MGNIALLPSDIESKGKYLGNKELPTNYMGDFTLMGFVVDEKNYREALTLLSSAGYLLVEVEGGTDISVNSSMHLAEIRVLLAANDIRVELSDIADTFYQA